VRFEANQKIIFIGDSITDCGRRDTAAPYGNGYVSLLRSLLLARYPERKLTIINKGISGNTTRDLVGRWQQDVIDEQPNWLSIMIGINDVWRTYDRGGEGAVSFDDYVSNLRSLIEQTKAKTSARLILAEPYMIEPDLSVPMRSQMDQYGAAVRQLAAEYDTLLVRTQAAFDEALQYTAPSDWADDKIHPNQSGHMIMAIEYARVLGFEL
jgi:lysophospholipase L1-like esterase